MNTSTAVDKILPKLALVKTELQAVTKGSNNPFFKSKYADLNTYLDEVEPLLAKNKMILLQPISETATNNTVESIIFDVESGQFVKSSMKLVGESDMQKAGSAVTYARRYTLGALLSMKAEDDDGNGASNKTSPGNKVANSSLATTATVKTTLTHPSNLPATTTVIPTATRVAAKPSFRKPRAAVTKVEATSTDSADDI